ncbi:carbohydrate esterase family 5 protein [Myriangium duriaei CBS 260.36]|uniref:cutinase n=1 Tax=Myriangium duriaei CBS 260.36 TaxID=1168546 RepID=A0A9P4IUW2_9PEZI|nr:carbohydrate esterase family 5 protein [Myriangium duriaei CBS 260.36]
MKLALCFIAVYLPLIAASPSDLTIGQCSKEDDVFPAAGPNCRPVTFIFARGSTEPGTLGIVVGPGVSCGLKSHYGARNVRSIGVRYPAKTSGNYEAEGCHAEGITQFVSDLTTTVSQCPNTKIVAGGFSQGAACLHAAFRRLDITTLARVVGVVTFGDTRNKQDGGKVPNFPPERTKIYCNKGDEVCNGVLKTSNAHRTYFKDTPAATRFLVKMIGPIQ